MPDDLDIYRSAKLLIDQHGEDAPIFAAMQADKRLAAGDLDGKATWMRVIGAIKELLNQQPPSAAPHGTAHITRLLDCRQVKWPCLSSSLTNLSAS